MYTDATERERASWEASIYRAFDFRRFARLTAEWGTRLLSIPRMSTTCCIYTRSEIYEWILHVDCVISSYYSHEQKKCRYELLPANSMVYAWRSILGNVSCVYGSVQRSCVFSSAKRPACTVEPILRMNSFPWRIKARPLRHRRARQPYEGMKRVQNATRAYATRARYCMRVVRMPAVLDILSFSTLLRTFIFNAESCHWKEIMNLLILMNSSQFLSSLINREQIEINFFFYDFNFLSSDKFHFSSLMRFPCPVAVAKQLMLICAEPKALINFVLSLDSLYYAVPSS